jgi:hypothetical protein
MAREQFIDSLRTASRLLTFAAQGFDVDRGIEITPRLKTLIREPAHPWLTLESVEGFDPADFGDWPESQRDKLAAEVSAFQALAQKVSTSPPATRTLIRQASKHLERMIEIVRRHLLPEWLQAQQNMVNEAMAAAETQGWYVEKDEKKLVESVLGSYSAPRLRIRTRDTEVVLDPIARFAGGEQGVVDLVVMPSYETAYLVAFKNGRWEIVSLQKSSNRRPFNQATLINTIARLSHD